MYGRVISCSVWKSNILQNVVFSEISIEDSPEEANNESEDSDEQSEEKVRYMFILNTAFCLRIFGSPLHLLEICMIIYCFLFRFKP